MIAGEVAADFADSERRKSPTDGTQEWRTDIVGGGNVIGKIRIGKTLVRTEPAATRGAGIIRAEDPNVEYEGPLVDSAEMVGE